MIRELGVMLIFLGFLMCTILYCTSCVTQSDHNTLDWRLDYVEYEQNCRWCDINGWVCSLSWPDDKAQQRRCDKWHEKCIIQATDEYNAIRFYKTGEIPE